MSMMPDLEPGKKPKRVLVVGAGAAGMACADTLAQHPERFDVTLVEAQSYCGGQMFSIPINKERHGAEWLNQGVQGGSNIYHHTFHMFGKLDHHPQPVDLQVSFGKGNTFWTNVFPTKLVERHANEIKRFAWVIKVMRWFEIFFAIIPIKISLKMFLFSDEFINCMIYPSLALFLGTGNATPNLPTVMMERLYTSPTYGMWYPIDPKMLTSNFPPMVVFPEASRVYADWKDTLEKKGVHVRLSTEVTQVISRSRKVVKVAFRPSKGSKQNTTADQKQNTSPIEGGEIIEDYDEIVICTLADTAKRILGKQARWIENKVLGATKWSDDVTVTHNDAGYMKKWYEVGFNRDVEQLAVSDLGGRDETKRIEEAKKIFKPMYYIKQTPADPRKLEMSFDCSAFQYQLDKDLPLDKHIFQTIFLNKKHEETWSKQEIAPDKIIAENWWHQLCHSYTHYLFVVPLLFLLNGKKRTTFAGSWTLVNAHEVAVISGVAAAYTLGAEYPKELEEDGFARLCFRLYLLLVHWRWFRRSK
ncbi:flavin-containing amine oxidasedehydrogenase [Moniliophthora roreri MCA 2997]|uniref:Flavin-containing amine oxidasedehydrogenase n=1 Tax=Moniliophthora roreri (strain MCA 2997) TaxID=1381753 RepID=V2XKM2_MONRO|nr:flavin-containing amine oxidasedehydrogenase [Moniliophthora roreri MCA 2997]